VGYGTGLGQVDGVKGFEIQACWITPGNKRTRVTGACSRVTREAIDSMIALVHEKARFIEWKAREAGWVPKKAAALPMIIKDGHDICVHVVSSPRAPSACLPLAFRLFCVV
jgi:hypothetical protein